MKKLKQLIKRFFGSGSVSEQQLRVSGATIIDSKCIGVGGGGGGSRGVVSMLATKIDGNELATIKIYFNGEYIPIKSEEENK